MKTTLNQIKQFNPCADGWRKLITYLGPDFPADKEFPVSEVVKSNGIPDTFWLLRRIMEPEALKRLVVEFACDCAERVLPIYESQYPDGPAPRRAIEATREWLENPTEENAPSKEDLMLIYGIPALFKNQEMAIKQAEVLPEKLLKVLNVEADKLLEKEKSEK